MYTWEEIATRFHFSPGYLSLAGGMISRPDLHALLLITYPGGAQSFDYDDYWDGDALVYTARGKTGNQQLVGQNWDLANNVRTNYVFEGGVGRRALRYVGTARSLRYWRARGKGDDGLERDIIRYRLEFEKGGRKRAAVRSRAGATRGKQQAAAHRRRRPFDPTREPASYSVPVQGALLQRDGRAAGESDTRPPRAARSAPYRAQAARFLQDRGDPRRSRPPRGRSRGRDRHLEAKVLTDANELGRTRAALAQLLEYQYFYGKPDNALCLITTRPIADRRLRFLESQQVSVAYDDGSGLVACGARAPKLLDVSP